MLRDPLALKELFIARSDADDERLWVPVSPITAFRPMFLSASQGYWISLTRVRGHGVISRHRHPGLVHGMTLKGSWRYLEHDWVAQAGSYIFEPPGDVHTLVVDEGPEEMVTMFQIHGAMVYLDDAGAVTAVDDVFTRIEQCRAHFAAVGLGADYVDQFVR
ncbi:2,4'-dihydroxyacetophenone dioxygenase family protein [Novosphingobium lentum]|uniref:2,4'-dihydroxyacetophenone dioxygenase family protein n=1 Tax=Novosphingobium lentum TaxID=145287 RepID=UPI0008327E4A|nr:2,4'-dihydroxyacetophenone dioxygenase family protein [Novosphingobium lentum]